MTETPTSRYASRPSEIQRDDWKSAASTALFNVLDENISLRCAGVAFFGVLSLFPALGVAVLLIGLIADLATLQQNLAAFSSFVPASVYDMLYDQVTTVGKASDTSLGIGLVFTLALGLWSGSRGINALISLVGVTYKEDNGRGMIMSAVVSILFLLGASFFTMALLAAIAATPIVLDLLPGSTWLALLISILRWPAIALCVFAAIACLYKYAPHRRSAQWRWVAPGAIASASLWLVASALFSLYVDQYADYNATFGSIATAVVLLLWFYYSVMTIAFGAELNAQLELRTRRDSTVGPSRPMGERGAYVADNMSSATSRS